MLHDFPAGGPPYTFMRADVLKRRVERADTMRLADFTLKRSRGAVCRLHYPRRLFGAGARR
jgi:hypothetical protein